MVASEDGWEEDASLFLVAASQGSSSSPERSAATEVLLEKHSVESIVDRVVGDEGAASCTAVRVLEALDVKLLGRGRMVALVQYGLSHGLPAVRRVAVTHAGALLADSMTSRKGEDLEDGLVRSLATQAVLDPSTTVAETASKSLKHLLESSPWSLSTVADAVKQVRDGDANMRARKRSLLSWLGAWGGLGDTEDVHLLANDSLLQDLDNAMDPLAQLAALEMLAEEAREGRGVAATAGITATSNWTDFERVARSVSRLAGPGESDLVGCRACGAAGTLLARALETRKTLGVVVPNEALESGCVALAEALASVVDPDDADAVSEERRVAGLSGVAEAGVSCGGAEAILSSAVNQGNVNTSTTAAETDSAAMSSMRFAASRLLRGIEVATRTESRPELRYTALFGLACLAGARRLRSNGPDLPPALLSSHDAEAVLKDLCYSISPARLVAEHESRLAAPNLFGALLHLAQVPFTEERLVAWATLGALLQRPWALSEASATPGLFSHICDPSAESQPEGREARFRCVCLIARALDEANVRGDQLGVPPLDAASVLEFAKAGPYGIPAGIMMHDAVPTVASRSAAGGP